MVYKYIYFILLVVYCSIPHIVEAQVCPTTLTCTLTGPPIWEYQYESTGSVGNMYGFKLLNVCDVTGVVAPMTFDGAFYDNIVAFISSGAHPCGTSLGVFRVNAPAATSALVGWTDFVNGSSGMVEGPACYPTPTPTGTWFTPTPTSTATIGPWPTPTLAPHLALISAGPPRWTYWWYGPTDGFHMNATCAQGDFAPADWRWVVSPYGGIMCFNILSPKPGFDYYSMFTVREVYMTLNRSIDYEALGPYYGGGVIDGPECISMTDTPTLTSTPTSTPMIGIPITDNQHRFVLFVLFTVAAACIVLKTVVK